MTAAALREAMAKRRACEVRRYVDGVAVVLLRLAWLGDDWWCTRYQTGAEYTDRPRRTEWYAAKILADHPDARVYARERGGVVPA